MHAPARSSRSQENPAGGLGVAPARVPQERVRKARELLAPDGAVTLTGPENTSDALVVATAQVIGDHPRELYPVRSPVRCRRGKEGAEALRVSR